ncbi:MAG TPA: FkbM family methyltransferase [Longimicrobiales bacterium]|nr:FkbM family methyltransferase [Longimicrobiales bacterium]
MDSSPDPAQLPPWGRLRPGAVARALTAATRAVPPWPLVKQLAFPLRRLARRFMPGPVDDGLWGHRLRFHPHGNISERRLLFMPDKWDRREREILARHARPGTVFLDVGCNFGGYTWWLLHLLGRECTVVALEPDPELYARLGFNLATNGWDNVTVLPYAAGERDGTAVLHIHRENRGENTLLPEGESAESDAVEVPLRTLATVVAEAGLPRVDILKVDIEGLEPPVIRAFFAQAAPEMLPRVILCERKDTPEHDALERFIVERGYRLEARTRLNMILVRERE